MSGRKSRDRLRRTREYVGPKPGPRAQRRRLASQTPARVPAKRRCVTSPVNRPPTPDPVRRGPEIFVDDHDAAQPNVTLDMVAGIVKDVTTSLVKDLKKDLVDNIKADILAQIGLNQDSSHSANSATRVTSSMPTQSSLPATSNAMVPLQDLGTCATLFNTTVEALEDGATAVPPYIFSSQALPVDAHVSEKLRQLVVSDQYIDMASLLPRPPTAPGVPEAGTFQLVDSVLKVVPSSKAKKIHTILEWQSAFGVYVAVYTKVHTNATTALMTYSKLITNLAKLGADWHFYDSNFRFYRQGRPEAFRWECPNWELHEAAKSRPRLVDRPSFGGQKSDRPFRSGSGGPKLQVPEGSCFRYHRGGKCLLPCKYSHKCFQCSAAIPHPAINCRKATSTRPSNKPVSTPQPANNSKPANTD